MTLDDVERFDLACPDGPHDAETLLVDPPTDDVFLVVFPVLFLVFNLVSNFLRLF